MTLKNNLKTRISLLDAQKISPRITIRMPKITASLVIMGTYFGGFSFSGGATSATESSGRCFVRAGRGFGWGYQCVGDLFLIGHRCKARDAKLHRQNNEHVQQDRATSHRLPFFASNSYLSAFQKHRVVDKATSPTIRFRKNGTHHLVHNQTVLKCPLIIANTILLVLLPALAFQFNRIFVFASMRESGRFGRKHIQFRAILLAILKPGTNPR